MSEWGNPQAEDACIIVKMRPTRGTETSQYPEEKKANAIASVVASESATAQTGGVGRHVPGLKGGRRCPKTRLAEAPGKVPRRG